MKRRERPKPLPGWNPPTDAVEIGESVSADEEAGLPLPPVVELRSGGPPVEIVEAYPNELPPHRTPRPFDREAVLAKLRSGFTSLTDDEMQVAELRMLGVPFLDISEAIALRPELVQKLWKRARRKLGAALFRESDRIERANRCRCRTDHTGTGAAVVSGHRGHEKRDRLAVAHRGPTGAPDLPAPSARGAAKAPQLAPARERGTKVAHFSLAYTAEFAVIGAVGFKLFAVGVRRLRRKPRGDAFVFGHATLTSPSAPRRGRGR
jgi:DNA-binding CsgD family transcriptional regulator